MHTSTKKWLFLKYSSLTLIPFMIWFIVNLVAIYDSDYIEVVNFFTKQPSKILFSIFIMVHKDSQIYSSCVSLFHGKYL